MFELVEAGGRAGVLQSSSSICWGQGQFLGKEATRGSGCWSKFNTFSSYFWELSAVLSQVRKLE